MSVKQQKLISYKIERRINDGTYQAEVGDELESADDYERNIRQREECAENLLRVRTEMGMEDSQETRDKAKRIFTNSDHPLAKPLKEFEDRQYSGHLKRRAEIAPMMLRAGEMCQTVPLTNSECGVSR